jgi:O-antigen/teichoic acid export membrane protein
MFEKIKRLTAETAIYGISTIIGRFLNFLLVPFYTNVLATSEFGIQANVYSIIAFLNVVYIYGLDTAYFKYASTLEIGDKKQNFTTPLFSILITSFAFSLMIHLFAGSIAATSFIEIPTKHIGIIKYSAWILFFDALCIIPFSHLRLSHKAKLFAGIKLINICVNIALNIVLLVVYKMGIEGIFISGLISSVLTFVLLGPIILKNFAYGFLKPLWKAVLKYGLPTVPAGLAAMTMQVIDRPILQALTDSHTVGIYQANHKLGIFMMLVVSMFNYAWQPFFFSTAKDANAKELFARVMTYFLLLAALIFLLISFFISDIVRIRIAGYFFIPPVYWNGLTVVPVILLAYIFTGIGTNLSAGIYIEKRTYYIPIYTGIGAAVSIIANYALIPILGILGAAYAVLLGYVSMAVVEYVIVQRLYYVRYELSRILKIVVSSGIVYAMYSLIHFEGAVVYQLLFKLILVITFAILLFVLKFFERGEVDRIRGIFSRISLSTRRTGEKSATTYDEKT